MGGRPTGRFRACVEVPAGVSRPHPLRQLLEGRQEPHGQLFQHPLYGSEEELVKSGHFVAELPDVLAMPRKSLVSRAQLTAGFSYPTEDSDSRTVTPEANGELHRRRFRIQPSFPLPLDAVVENRLN